MKNDLVKIKYQEVILECDECGTENPVLWVPDVVVEINSKITSHCSGCSASGGPQVDTEQTVIRNNGEVIQYYEK